MPNRLLLSYRSKFQPPGRDLGFPLFKSVITPFITPLANEADMGNGKKADEPF
jgi:hypothetical protein